MIAFTEVKNVGDRLLNGWYPELRMLEPPGMEQCLGNLDRVRL